MARSGARAASAPATQRSFVARLLLTQFRRPFRLLPAIALLVAMVACGSTPTSPSTAFTSTTQLAVGSLTPGGTSIYNFATSAQSFVRVTLASVTTPANDPVEGTFVLAFGTQSGASCTATATQTVTVGLSAQIVASVPAGSYCIRVTDTGALQSSGVFAARVTSASGEPPTTAANGTDVFSSALNAGGTAERSFSLTKGGNVAITFASGTDVAMRLTLGLWDGSVCRATLT